MELKMELKKLKIIMVILIALISSEILSQNKNKSIVDGGGGSETFLMNVGNVLKVNRFSDNGWLIFEKFTFSLPKIYSEIDLLVDEELIAIRTNNKIKFYDTYSGDVSYSKKLDFKIRGDFDEVLSIDEFSALGIRKGNKIRMYNLVNESQWKYLKGKDIEIPENFDEVLIFDESYIAIRNDDKFKFYKIDSESTKSTLNYDKEMNFTLPAGFDEVSIVGDKIAVKKKNKVKFYYWNYNKWKYEQGMDYK